jgi:hypothetical protein
MNRRSFFTRTLGAIAATTIAPLVKFAAPEKPMLLGLSGTYGGINRATFSFWRNQSTLGTSPVITYAALKQQFDACKVGGNYVGE